MTGALAHLRVLEIGDLEAAAYCGKLFADFGAQVLKLEPEGGDSLRRHPPLVEAAPGVAQSALFAWLNTNKQSRFLKAAGLDELAAAADVIIDARPDGEARAWRERLRVARPDATLVSLSWFGESGPYAGFAGSDAVVRALAGILWPMGEPGRAPEALADHQASVWAGLHAFTAAMADRLSAQPGRRFEVSVLESCLPIAEFYVTTALADPSAERRYGRNRFRPTFPMGIYPCREGWLGVTVVTIDQWRAFCELFDLAELAADPELMTPVGRFTRADELEAMFTPRLATKTAAEWFALAHEKRLPFVIAPGMAELLGNRVHRDRGAFATVSIGQASFEGPALPHHLTRPAVPAGGPAPLLGDGGPAWAPRPQPAPRSGSDPIERPLAGVRLLDLTMGWAGPLATRMLGDLGAEIVKVESCGYADWWRSADPREAAVRERQFEKSPIFNALNRNKLGVTLDLTTPDGAALLKRLVGACDAVIENYSREVLPKLGLDYVALRQVDPELVMVSMPAFGGDTEWGDVRAYGSTLEHASGLPSVTGAPDAPPTMAHLALGDPVGGFNAAAAVLIALAHKRRTGEGQHIDLSQVESLFPMAAPWIIQQSVLGAVERCGTRHPVYCPHGIFRCAGEEAWLAVSVTHEAAWAGLIGAIGRADLAGLDLASRRGRAAELEGLVQAWCAEREPHAAMRALQAKGVAAGVLQRPSALLADPHLTGRGVWQWIDRPWIGRHPQLLCAIREEHRPYPALRPAPLLGEFNGQVLGALGLSDQDLAALAQAGVVGQEITIRAVLGRRAPSAGAAAKH